MNDADEKRDRLSTSPLGETIDVAARRIMTGLVLGGAAIALAIYSRPGPPRYQVETTATGIVRIDTRSGTVLSCEGRTCYQVVRRGQRLAPNPPAKTLPATQPRPALPVPAATPSAGSEQP